MDSFFVRTIINSYELVHKIKKRSIILHIGKCDIFYNNRQNKKTGYYILNIILFNSKINKYGLYNKYIDGEEYVSKPLNYINQPIDDSYTYLYTDEQIKELEFINSVNYKFTSYQNNLIFSINYLIAEDIRREENSQSLYTNKYLKYKKKYNSLKKHLK